MSEAHYPPSWQAHPEWMAAHAANEHWAGIHHFSSLLGCLRRAAHDDGGEDADFGTNVHAWLDAYHSGRPLPELSMERGERTCSEVTLVERYADRFPSTSLGTTLMGEGRLFGVLTLHGVDYPISGGLDRVTSMGPLDVADFYESRRGVVLEPGIYLHDFKTKKQHSGITVPTLTGGDQATLYVELIRQNHPEWASELRGTLFHILYRYLTDSDKQFQTINVGLPTDEAERRLRGVVEDGAKRLAALGWEHMSPNRCYDFNRTCPQYEAGCPRTNYVDDLV